MRRPTTGFVLAALWLVCFACSARAQDDASRDALAQTVLQKGDTAAALAVLVAARKAEPSDASLSQQIETIVSGGLPAALDPALLPDLPVESVPLPDSLGTLVVPNSYLPTPATEPQHDWPFSKVIYLYDSALPGKPVTLFCRVHYTTPDDAALAARSARLLALAHTVLVHQTGREAANSASPFDVWLCRGGHTGGEQWQSNLYLYDLDSPRSSIEWIREIVHEYSHLALPPVGGYKSPEYWANGYLGEALILRWFQHIPNGTGMVERAWGDFRGATNYDHLVIAPAKAQYAKIGPNAKWLTRTDADGMRYFIGAVLTLEDKHGSLALGDAFDQLPRFSEARAADLVSALRQSRQSRLSR